MILLGWPPWGWALSRLDVFASFSVNVGLSDLIFECNAHGYMYYRKKRKKTGEKQLKYAFKHVFLEKPMDFNVLTVASRGWYRKSVFCEFLSSHDQKNLELGCTDLRKCVPTKKSRIGGNFVLKSFCISRISRILIDFVALFEHHVRMEILIWFPISWSYIQENL